MLPESPSPTPSIRTRLESDYERFRDGLPAQVEDYCRETYGLDLTAEYAGRPIRNPFGKASGQLSLNLRQVQRDVEGGLGFVVLKTVIAEDDSGTQSMSEWAIHETHMRVERITGSDGNEGWTVTWKGRGWHESFDRYLRFFEDALTAGQQQGVVVAPSVKYHLPAPGSLTFREEEYRYTTGRLLEVYRRHAADAMPLEKDFSPTLAGDDRSREQEQILLWLRRVPEIIRATASGPLCLGMKLMNACFDLEFQLEMLRAVTAGASSPPDFLIYANRLFDPQREFEGKVGVAYGGPDLSWRNLEALALAQRAVHKGRLPELPPISATGDILCGRTAVAYALLGATSCQMHTAFQLPDSEYAARTRNKAAAVLHHFLFHPESGVLAWLDHFSQRAGAPVHWRDLPRLGSSLTE